jgi:ribosome-associated translation inhibitor RaiA
MEVKRPYFEITNRFGELKKKFDDVFGSADVTIDMHMQDQWIEVSVMIKHLEKMKQAGDQDSELYNMTYDLIDRKMGRLERYINKMVR